MSGLSTVFLFLFLAFVVAADVCDNYVSFSTTVTDAFCQNSACRGYCALGSDVVKCMKMVYEDNFKECTLASNPTQPTTQTPTQNPTQNPTQKPTLRTTTTRPVVQSTLPTLPPVETPSTDCSLWSGLTPDRDEWCQTVGCYNCVSKQPGFELDDCLFHLTRICNVPNAPSVKPTRPPSSSFSSITTDCSKWAGLTADQDQWCQTVGCMNCQGKTGFELEGCLFHLTRLCSVPNAPPTKPTLAPATLPPVENPSTDCSKWVGLTPDRDEWCQTVGCYNCVSKQPGFELDDCLFHLTRICSVPNAPSAKPTQSVTNPTPGPTITSVTSTRTYGPTYTFSLPPVDNPSTDCSRWAGYTPDRDQWCRTVGCRNCIYLTGVPLQCCLRDMTRVCSVPDVN